jgi:pyrroloquinoline-quinone synthase
LKKFYGIEDTRTVAFFRAHETVDVWHRQVERDILVKDDLTLDAQERVLDATEQAARALWGFLDGVCAAYVSPHR